MQAGAQGGLDALHDRVWGVGAQRRRRHRALRVHPRPVLHQPGALIIRANSSSSTLIRARTQSRRALIMYLSSPSSTSTRRARCDAWK